MKNTSKKSFPLLLLLVLPPLHLMAQPDRGEKITPATVEQDYHRFFSRGRLGAVAVGLGAAGLLANTAVDNDIQRWYQQSVRSTPTDAIAKVVKPIGNGKITLPVYFGAFLLGELTKKTAGGATLGVWASRSLRGILTGAPTLLFLQVATGASRPSESNSHWHPFKDDNGVSGHSFMGAVPFLAAASMVQSRLAKGGLILASTFTGMSRINDNAHYFSQAALGWWLAYLATPARQRPPSPRVLLIPDIRGDRVGSLLRIEL